MGEGCRCFCLRGFVNHPPGGQITTTNSRHCLLTLLQLLSYKHGIHASQPVKCHNKLSVSFHIWYRMCVWCQNKVLLFERFEIDSRDIRFFSKGIHLYKIPLCSFAFFFVCLLVSGRFRVSGSPSNDRLWLNTMWEWILRRGLPHADYMYTNRRQY